MSQGLKLRSLTWANQAVSEKSSSEKPYPALWSTPRSPAERLRLHPLCPFSIPGQVSRMAPVYCNHPSTTGYSFSWNSRLTKIHSHMTGEDLSVYKTDAQSNEHEVWIYFPMNPGDSVSEIWKREPYINVDPTILFKTRQGHLHLFGPHIAYSWQEYTWTLIDCPEARPCTFWYDELGYDLAFENHKPPQQQSLPPQPEILAQKPGWFGGHFFHSEAMLNDATEVIPCRSATTNRVSGLLLRYANGSEAALGVVRLDCLSRPVRLSRGDIMWLEFVKVEHTVFMRSVRFSRPPHGSTSHWFPVPKHGRLEWWFSARECQITHEGRTSPFRR